LEGSGRGLLKIEETIGTSVRIVSVPVESRSEHLPDTGLEGYF
jgi:hypothetical protein